MNATTKTTQTSRPTNSAVIGTHLGERLQIETNPSISLGFAGCDLNRRRGRVQAKHRIMVASLLAVAIRQSRESAKSHSRGEVEALHAAGADFGFVNRAADPDSLEATEEAMSKLAEQYPPSIV